MESWECKIEPMEVESERVPLVSDEGRTRSYWVYDSKTLVYSPVLGIRKGEQEALVVDALDRLVGVELHVFFDLWPDPAEGPLSELASQCLDELADFDQGSVWEDDLSTELLSGGPLEEFLELGYLAEEERVVVELMPEAIECGWSYWYPRPRRRGYV